jgi:hypothetical protein
MSPDDLTPEPDRAAEQEIAEFLRGVPKEPAAIMAAFEQRALVEEAALAARGVHPVSVVHGDPDSEKAVELIFGTLHRLAEEAGHFTRTVGGNDYTTWFFEGPGAEQAAVKFIAAVTAIAEPWWIVTATAQPKFYR